MYAKKKQQKLLVKARGSCPPIPHDKKRPNHSRVNVARMILAIYQMYHRKTSASLLGWLAERILLLQLQSLRRNPAGEGTEKAYVRLALITER